MKKTILKLLAIFGAFFGIIMLVFKSSSKGDKLDREIKDNENKLDELKDDIIEVAKEKEKTKKKISTAKKKVAKTKASKKSTKSAKKKAKNFKKKYKSKKKTVL